MFAGIQYATVPERCSTPFPHLWEKLVRAYFVGRFCGSLHLGEEKKCGKGKNMGGVVIYITLYHVTTAESDSVTLSLVFTLVQCHTLTLCREQM